MMSGHYLIDSESSGGVGELTQETGTDSIVQGHNSLSPDHLSGQLNGRQFTILLGLQGDL